MIHPVKYLKLSTIKCFQLKQQFYVVMKMQNKKALKMI